VVVLVFPLALLYKSLIHASAIVVMFMFFSGLMAAARYRERSKAPAPNEERSSGESLPNVRPIYRTLTMSNSTRNVTSALR
jgi:hypothetical protein